MTREPDDIVKELLRARLRITAAVVAVVRDVHAADDIFQQVVLAALEHREQFREGEHVLAWAIRMARHRALNLARSRHLLLLPDDVLDVLEMQCAELEASANSDLAEELHRCLSRLGPPARGLLRMRYDEGLKVATIAARLQRSTDAVYQNLSRVLRLLRECVERRLAAGQLSAREGDRPSHDAIS